MSLSTVTFARRTLIVLGATAVLNVFAAEPVPATVVDVIAHNPALTTLSGLLNSSGLAQTLSGTGPFTVFAPDDNAFKAAPAKVIEELKQNPDKLREVLTFHVVPAKITSADAKNGKVKSVLGADIEISKSGDFVTVESAVVSQADQLAGNGVVHVIDTVLLPPVKK